MKYKILVIDDSIVNINALYIMLRESYQIYVAKNGKDGIEEAKKTEPSLILLDILMPGMDGFEVLDLLKRDPMTKRIPVMFITSLNDDKSEEKGLALGAVDYITKPFNPSIIKAKVKNHVELYEYRRMVENIALLDGLTSIPNRRSYDETSKEYWQTALREHRPFSVAIMDIDYFKEYNDNYGHLCGDEALKKVAVELKRSLPKKGGFLARYGGEEFVVLLDGFCEKDANEIIEEMRLAVQALNIEHLYSLADRVLTLSAGGFTTVPENKRIEEAVVMADKRLYRAKSMGRNCTVWEDSEAVIGQIEVTLFGHLRLITKQGELTDRHQEKSRMWLFIAFLLINRNKEYTKEDLLHAIWPFEEIRDGSYELKILLEELRIELKRLKVEYARELIVTINGVYRFNTSILCSVDIEVFEHLYEEAMAEKNRQKQYELCERAVSMYKDEFLARVVTVEWVEELRNWFVGMQERMLELLLSLCYEREEYEKMVKLCQRQLYNEDFDERIHFYYLKALLQLKRNKEALNHYEYIVESHYSKQSIAPPKSITSLYPEIVRTSKEGLCKIEQIETMIKENTIAVGAYYCNMHVFQNIYQLEARSMIRTGKMYYLGLVDIEKDQYFDKKQITIYMHDLLSTIKRVLRIGDIFCKVTEYQYAILLPCTSYEVADRVLKRIVDHFYENYEEDEVALSLELAPMKPAETLQVSSGIRE